MKKKIGTTVATAGVLTIVAWYVLSAERATNQVTIAPEFHDFGVVRAVDGPTKCCTFTINNAGRKGTRIVAVKPTCSCSATGLSPGILGPGESKSVEVCVNIGESSGSYSPTVLVEFEGFQLLLRMKMFVIKPVTFVPSQLVFSDVPSGATIERAVEVYRMLLPKEDAGQHVEVRSDIPMLKCNVKTRNVIQCEDSEGHLGQRELVILEARLDGAGEGTLRGMIEVRWPTSGLVASIPVTANVVGDIRVEPKELFFGVLHSGHPATRSVTISLRNNESFCIRRVVPDSALVCASWSPARAAKHVVSVTTGTVNQSALLKGNLEVTTDIRSHPKFTIPWWAIPETPKETGGSPQRN